MTPREELSQVLDDEHAGMVLDHRKAIRKPLAASAAKLLAKEFAKCPDPNAAAEEMILRCWQGFRAEWMQPKPAKVQHQSMSDLFGAISESIDARSGRQESDRLAGEAVRRLPFH